MMLPVFLVFALSFLLHLFAVRWFPRWNLLDFPERYDLRRKRLPYPAGILTVALFLLFFLVWQRPIDMQEWGLLIGVLLLGATCFADDRTPLPSWLRLLLQLFIAFLIFATGTRIYTITNPLEGVMMTVPFLKLDSWKIMLPFFGTLPVLGGLFTVVWLFLTMNALNWFDGIPGQVSLLSVIGFLTIGFLAASDRVLQPHLALIAFVLAAIAAGGLLFEIPVQRVVLGDSGSMFFGLLLGTLTIYAGGKVATAFLVLGVPLIDSVLVILRRLFAGRSPLRGDNDHLHHRLLRRGWSQTEVLLLTAVLGGGFGITALFLSTPGKFIASLALLIVMLLLTRYSRTVTVSRSASVR